MSMPLVVGLGSHSGDDQAGWLILDRLRDLGYPESSLRKAAHPADILDVLDRSNTFVICDACHGGGPPGTVHCWPWPSQQVRTMHAHGTHDMGLNETLELACFLGWSPHSVEIWAVEGHAWSPATSMGSDVRTATQTAAEAIRRKYSDA